jgi:endonuclease G
VLAPEAAGPNETEITTPAGPESVRIDPDYENRHGFDPGFLPGIKVPLLDLIPKALRQSAAPLKGNGNDANGELRYQHFSVVMHAKRHLAILTATNIDGETYIKIDRDTGLPKAEAAERWYDDPRIDDSYLVLQAFYSANQPIFDRGHLTRREDVNWGTKERAIRANADTFHFSNCTPQQKKFNESRKFWQGIEQYYLEYGATLDKSRLIVLQGPVFNDKLDRPYDDGAGGEVLVPLQFWKIVLRVENGAPKATGFLASQAELLSVPKSGAEAMHPPRRARVSSCDKPHCRADWAEARQARASRYLSDPEGGTRSRVAQG